MPTLMRVVALGTPYRHYDDLAMAITQSPPVQSYDSAVIPVIQKKDNTYADCTLLTSQANSF